MWLWMIMFESRCVFGMWIMLFNIYMMHVFSEVIYDNDTYTSGLNDNVSFGIRMVIKRGMYKRYKIYKLRHSCIELYKYDDSSRGGYIALCWIFLYFVLFYCILLYFIAFCCISLHFVILLYFIVSCCILLYFVVL